MHAVFYGYYGATKILLDRGANIESKDSGGATAIIIAVRGNITEKIVPLLIKRGANLKVMDKEGYSPLGWALYYKKMDIALLIKSSIADARKNVPSARIVWVREYNALIPGNNQDVLIYVGDQLVANLIKSSTDYLDIDPGKFTMVIKSGKLEGNNIKSFDAIAGKTYYFAVSRRIGSMVASFHGELGTYVESQFVGENAGPFEITPMEESIAKERIKVIQRKN
jgi:ankyrin repeat protein